MASELLNIVPRMPGSKAKKLRRQGYIPGMLYGSDNSPVPVLFDRKETELLIQRTGEAAVFDVNINGETMQVRIMDIQRDPVLHHIIHMDLQHVTDDKIVHTQVPLVFEGREMAQKKGLVIQRQYDAIEVKGPSKDIPPYIKVPLDVIRSNKSIRVQDLEIAGELSIIDAPNKVLASITKPSGESETVEDA